MKKTANRRKQPPRRIPISEARKQLPALVRNARHESEVTIITQGGADAAVLVSPAEYERRNPSAA